jgi:small subunit ribosomal protein S19e
MVTVKEVEAQKLITKLAERLEEVEEVKAPEYAAYVKTGVSRERPPEQDNWWMIRSASILRKIYIKPKIGVSKLRKAYGGRKNLGHKPEHRRLASGSIIRRILHQLEAAGLVKKEPGSDKRPLGRVLTPKGQKFLDETAKMAK